MIDLSRLWVAERIVCGFFLYLALLAAVLDLEPPKRGRVVGTALACIGAILLLSRMPPPFRVVREWLPAVCLLAGYWTSGVFFRRPMGGIERMFLAWDRMIFRASGLRIWIDRAPRVLLEFLELTYLTVYPFIPASFGLFCGLGFRDATDEFWTAVLIAAFPAYGTLPWIQTRPPRTLEQPSDSAGALVVRRVNRRLLDRASVQANTFPSAHASMAVAAALAIAGGNRAWGVPLLAYAGCITLATVIGRYHFAIDSVLGAALGIIGWWIGFRVLGGA